MNALPHSGWTEKYYLVCARQGTGGRKVYDKLYPEWGRFQQSGQGAAVDL